MPNHCTNTLKVHGAEYDVRNFARDHYRTPDDWSETASEALLRKENKKILDFSYSCPFPDHECRENDQGWFDWCISNWGTKWGAYDIYPETFPDVLAICEGGGDDTLLPYQFDTAWAPPLEWLANISPKYPDLTFTLEYYESGCDFMGVFSIKDGDIQTNVSTSISEALGEDFDWDKDDAYDQQNEKIMEFFTENAWLFISAQV